MPFPSHAIRFIELIPGWHVRDGRLAGYDAAGTLPLLGQNELVAPSQKKPIAVAAVQDDQLASCSEEIAARDNRSRGVRVVLAPLWRGSLHSGSVQLRTARILSAPRNQMQVIIV